MKIGLIRHLKVNQEKPKLFMTQVELFEWIKRYDTSDVHEESLILEDIHWERCFSSDLSRAVKTAQTVFDGEIIKMKELREITVSPINSIKIKLPYQVWMVVLRIAWLFHHTSQKDSKAIVKKRIEYAVNEIMRENHSTLIVSHGALMIMLRKELLKRGFKGPKIIRAKNGELYYYEKADR